MFLLTKKEKEEGRELGTRELKTEGLINHSATVCSLVCLFISLLIPFVHLFARSCVRSITHAFVHSLVCSFFLSLQCDCYKKDGCTWQLKTKW